MTASSSRPEPSTSSRAVAPAFTPAPPGPFSLGASIRFLEGFAPAGYDATGAPGLGLAFPVEGSLGAGRGAGGTGERRYGARPGLHRPAFPRGGRGRCRRRTRPGRADPVAGRRRRRLRRRRGPRPGRAPTTAALPRAAPGHLLVPLRGRLLGRDRPADPHPQAAAVKARITDRLGTAVAFPDRRVTAFPGPAELLDAGRSLEGIRGLAARKPQWLRGIADAALEGRLDAPRLRAMPRREALADLRSLPGIGPFSAELVLLRGAGDPDTVPSHERRLRRAIGEAYRLPGEIDDDALRAISDRWRPYRTWVSVLLRTWLEDETHEITRARQG